MSWERDPPDADPDGYDAREHLERASLEAVLEALHRRYEATASELLELAAQIDWVEGDLERLG